MTPSLSLAHQLKIVPTDAAQNEMQLIERCRQGDTIAYEALYKLNVGKIYALCLRLCNDTALAEDMTQETFIKGWQKLAKFRGDSRFSTWLYRLCSNLVIDHLRARKTWLSFVETDSAETTVLDNDFSVSHDNEHHQDVETILATLPEQARAILILYEIVGYQHNEIAKITGLAVGTCKSQLHRARKLLQERFA